MPPDRWAHRLFDDREREPTASQNAGRYAARKTSGAARVSVRRQAIDAVYITPPAATNERVLDLIGESAGQ